MKTARLLIILLVTMNLGILIYATQGQTKSPNASKVIRAQSIELVDSKGQVRALLNVEESGETVFRLKDAKGTIRVKMGASEDGSALVMLNHETDPGVHVLAKESGSSITLTSESGERKRIQP